TSRPRNSPSIRSAGPTSIQPCIRILATTDRHFVTTSWGHEIYRPARLPGRRRLLFPRDAAWDEHPGHAAEPRGVGRLRPLPASAGTARRVRHRGADDAGLLGS